MANPSTKLRNPLELFQEGSFHGGVWRLGGVYGAIYGSVCDWHDVLQARYVERAFASSLHACPMLLILDGLDALQEEPLQEENHDKAGGDRRKRNPLR